VLADFLVRHFARGKKP